VISFTRIFAYLLAFVRNVILARSLAKGDYGLSAAFATAIAMLELAGRSGVNQLVVQARYGNRPGFVACAHTVQLAAGAASAILLLALSVPIADLFKVPQAAWAFGMLALIPLLNGAGHLDNSRLQRRIDFVPAALAEVLPQMLVTLATWPFVVWLPDYRAVLWLLIIKTAMSVAVTHLLAERRYRLRWKTQWIAEIYKWSWPLVLSGILVFLSQQANQLVIGNAFSVANLAGYAIAVSLVSVPWFVLASLATSLLLPILSAQQNRPELNRIARLCLPMFAVAAVLLFIPTALCGEVTVIWLFGARYVGAGIFVAILASGVAIRLFSLLGSSVALACGDTRNDLYANVCRCISLPLAISAAAHGMDLRVVVACGAVGDLVGGFVAMLRVRGLVSIPARDMLKWAVYVVFFITIGFLYLLMEVHKVNVLLHFCLVSALCCCAIVFAAKLVPEVADKVAAALKDRGRVIWFNYTNRNSSQE
jgi:O-antigen/teichoic acid export membrane protein